VGQLVVPANRCAVIAEAAGQFVEHGGVDAERRVGLVRGPELGLDPDVQLSVAQREPHPAPGLQRRRLLHLGQSEQLAVEATRLGFAAGRRGDLHVVQIRLRRHADRR